ncbi:MAG: DNRLRE domain-containing protein [Armatimonadetes bacterium]|nr:DNRLRE domain-containing protein [Armatimonadota bacterium]
MPTAIFQRSDTYTGTQDTRICSTNPAATYHSATDMNVAVNHVAVGDERILLRFDLASVPPAAAVQSASLELYLAQLVSGAGLASLEVYALAESWHETECSWQNRASGQPWQTPGGSLGTLLGTVAGNAIGAKQLASGALREAVQGWVSDPDSNHGLLVKAPADDEASTPYTNMLFRPGEYSGTAQRPKLALTYSVPVGTPALAYLSRTANSLRLSVAHGSPGDDPVAGTEIYLSGDPETPIADCPISESEVTLGSLVSGRNYYITARTYDASAPRRLSARSPELAAPAAPPPVRPVAVCEVFASLEDWPQSEGLSVSGNAAFASGQPPGGASRPVASGPAFRLQADIAVSKNANCHVGVSSGETVLSVGYSMANGGLALYDGAIWRTILSAASIQPGQRFHAQLLSDGCRISATVFPEGSLNEYHASFPLADFVPDSLLVRSESPQDKVARLGFRSGLSPFPDARFDHLMVVSSACPSGHPIRFRLPPSYDGSAGGHKACLLCHASGQYVWTFWETTTPPRKQLHDALLEDGWVLVLPEAATRHWGQDEMLSDVELACDYAARALGCQPRMGVFASSMGGLMAFLAAAACPDRFKGIAAVYPVCDLDDMFDGGLRSGENFHDYIASAYGVEAEGSSDPAYRQATAGHNPLALASALARIPMSIWHGAEDATVPLSAHSRPFAERVSAAGGSIALHEVPAAGHGATGEACWDIPSILSFLNACATGRIRSRLNRLLARRGRR